MLIQLIYTITIIYHRTICLRNKNKNASYSTPSCDTSYTHMGIHALPIYLNVYMFYILYICKYFHTVTRPGTNGVCMCVRCQQ